MTIATLVNAAGCAQTREPAINQNASPKVTTITRDVYINETRNEYKNFIKYEDLLRLQYDCSQRKELIKLLEEQIKHRNFYTIDGVVGNEEPDRISKKYFSYVRYKIWNLRLGCQGSNVDESIQNKLKETLPTLPPDTNTRCYFEEQIVTTSNLKNTEEYQDTFVSQRKEICTNYPLLSDAKRIRIGNLVDPKHQLDRNFTYIPNLRKWNGNIFQLATKTEIHKDEIVKFTLVLMWTARGWLVVDKF